MKVLWVGDTPTVSSGFGRCTEAACAELHRAGHEVHVLGLNEYGGPHDYPYAIYPCYHPLDSGRDAFGVTRLPVLVERLEPDLVVLLNDPWNIPGYLDNLEGFAKRRAEQEEPLTIPPIVGWLAVDSKNQKAKPLNRLAHVAVWTKFAADELRAGGYQGDPSIIPLGVDPHFTPRDRAESRKMIGLGDLPDSAYVVGVVGRNQPRKRLDLTIAYFAEWIRECNVPDAYLFLHVAPTGDRGVDIPSLVRYHGLSGRVRLAEPSIGVGTPSKYMPNVYSAFDCYLTTTAGEGWGLAALEAMACGVPVIAPDSSALGCWARDAALLVPCTSTQINAPLNSLAYTIGGVVDREKAVEALHRIYQSRDWSANTKGGWADLRERGMALAAEYSWQRASAMMREVIESVVAQRGAACSS